MIRYTDFIRLIMRGNLRDAVSAMTDNELECSFGSDFLRTRGFDQKNPHHCFDVLDHILCATEALDTDGLSEADAITLKTALFFHDVGKPRCATPKENRLVFKGHAKISSSIARSLLPEIGFSPAETGRICFFIEYHDVFMPLRLSDDLDKHRPESPVISEKTVGDILQTIRSDAAGRPSYFPSDADFRLLPRICRADSLAQAETTYRNGLLRDTRENKLARVEEIRRCIEKITHRTADENSFAVCLFGASSNDIPQEYKDAARHLGELTAKAGFGMVFGAGGRGLMGEAAKGAHCANGMITGVLPEKLNLANIVSPYCTELFIEPTMHERKAHMERLSSGFIAMAGGFGTFEELLEILTLKQLGYFDAPIAILNTRGYFDDLIAMFEHCTDEGFADKRYLGLYRVCKTPEEAIAYMTDYAPTDMPEKTGAAVKYGVK